MGGRGRRIRLLLTPSSCRRPATCGDRELSHVAWLTRSPSLPEPQSGARPLPAQCVLAIAFGRAAIGPVPPRSCPPRPGTSPASPPSRLPRAWPRPSPQAPSRCQVRSPPPETPECSDPGTPRVGPGDQSPRTTNSWARRREGEGYPRGRLAALRVSQLVMPEPSCLKDAGSPRLCPHYTGEDAVSAAELGSEPRFLGRVRSSAPHAPPS